MTEEQIQKITDRLNRYYETNEIDIDLVNHIHNDACAMMRVMKHLQQQNKQLIESLEEIKEKEWELAGEQTPSYLIAHFSLQQIQGKGESL